MNGAEFLVKFFQDKGVDLIFGYPGGSVIFLYDVLGKSTLKHVLTRHEQGAVHAADGYARVTGKPGVCFATSGPGATNLVTGLANAYLDSVPILAITGQVALDSIGRDSFQEADIIGITMPISKHSYIVKDIGQLPVIMEEAWNVAVSGRPGPVVIDIPKDIFTKDVDASLPVKRIATRKGPRKNGLEEQLDKVVSLLSSAQRPLIFAGGGVVSAQAGDTLKQIVEHTRIPVVTTLMGKGALAETRDDALGMVGMHGKPSANLALNACDVLLALGVRFSDRVTGDPKRFLPDTAVIHVDIDAAELCKNVIAQVPVVCDAGKFLTKLNEKIIEKEIDFQLTAWLEQIKEWQGKYPLTYEKSDCLKPQEVIEEVARQAGSRAVVVTDVGQHQMFTAQYYPVSGRRNFITSGGLGTMGFGLPAAVGAALGRPGENVILFTGDGSIQMNIQELATAAKNRLPLKIFLLNNVCLGMVRQWQELFFQGNYAHTILEGNPDFIKLAEAYGLKALKLKEPQDIALIVEQALREPGPVFVECVVDPGENVFPIIPPGGKPNEMLGRWPGETHISRIS